MGACSWILNNSLYLFGGFYLGYSANNELWKFEIDTTCSLCSQNILLPIPQFTLIDSSFCGGACIDFINQSVNATNYQWFFPGGTPASDTSANPQNICYYTPGSYSVLLTAGNTNGSTGTSIISAIVVNPPISNQPITQNGDTLFAPTGFSSYQWFYNSTLLNGDTGYYYVANQSGNYSVQIADSNGCSAVSTKLGVIADVEEQKSFQNFDFVCSDNTISIFVNSLSNIRTELSISDDLGRILIQKKIHLNEGENSIVINDINFNSGIYFLRLGENEKRIIRKITIAR